MAVSSRGKLEFKCYRETQYTSVIWYVESEPNQTKPSNPRFHFTYTDVLANAADLFLLEVPHWFAMLLSAAFAALPWLPWWSQRFRIRTLLIVTTLLAVMMGLAVHATGK